MKGLARYRLPDLGHQNGWWVTRLGSEVDSGYMRFRSDDETAHYMVDDGSRFPHWITTYAKRGDGSIFLMYFDDGRIFRPTWWWRMLDRVSRMIGGSAA
jgi:hypothetical protein